MKLLTLKSKAKGENYLAHEPCPFCLSLQMYVCFNGRWNMWWTQSKWHCINVKSDEFAVNIVGIQTISVTLLKLVPVYQFVSVICKSKYLGLF